MAIVLKFVFRLPLLNENRKKSISRRKTTLSQSQKLVPPNRKISPFRKNKLPQKFRDTR